MPQLLSLSRAARLAEVSRGDLQQRIRHGDLPTFEGKIAVSDLLRVYPEVDVDSNAVLERVERIKAFAQPKMSYRDSELPSAEVLVSRLQSLSEVLVKNKASLNAAEQLLGDLESRLRKLAVLEDAGLRAAVEQLASWLSTARIHLADHVDRGAKFFAKDTFLRIMAANVKVIPSGHDFFVEGTESILDASVRSGLNLNYGCSSGNCGSCKARVVSGEVWKTREHDYVLSAREKQMGYVLTCSNTAITDLVLEAAEALSARDLPQQEVRAVVRKVEEPEAGLLQLSLQTPRTQTLRFLAGQRATLRTEDGVSGEYSIASCPCNARNLQFLLRRRSGDAFAEVAGDRLQPGQVVSVEGPRGEFVLHDDDPNPSVFVAFGDGFAPIRSLIEHAISIDIIESFRLYWVASEGAGHYADRLCRSWRDSLDNFVYAALAPASPEALAERIAREEPELGQANFYLAGDRQAVEQLQHELRQRGVDEDSVRTESL